MFTGTSGRIVGDSYKGMSGLARKVPGSRLASGHLLLTHWAAGSSTKTAVAEQSASHAHASLLTPISEDAAARVRRLSIWSPGRDKAVNQFRGGWLRDGESDPEKGIPRPSQESPQQVGQRRVRLPEFQLSRASHCRTEHCVGTVT